MGNIKTTYLPPQNWQDFETLMKGVIDVIWQQDGWQLYGRPGQSQSGIDLYGYDNKNRFTGIQCKKKNQTDSEGILLTNSLLTRELIETEIRSAEKIDNPSIKRYIFTTTSSRDTNIQDLIREINHKRKENNKFSVEIWFWEDIQVYIENHTELAYWYYQEYLENICKYDKNIHIITLLRQAFTRPAFQHAIRMEESGVDFIKAIKDTQEAITTGHLYNRRGDLIASSYSYLKISNEKWKKSIKSIYDYLEEIRTLYKIGLNKRSIIEHPTCLEFLDFELSEQFNVLRSKCLIKMNQILKELELAIIDSELIIR